MASVSVATETVSALALQSALHGPRTVDARKVCICLRDLTDIPNLVGDFAENPPQTIRTVAAVTLIAARLLAAFEVDRTSVAAEGRHVDRTVIIAEAQQVLDSIRNGS